MALVVYPYIHIIVKYQTDWQTDWLIDFYSYYTAKARCIYSDWYLPVAEVKLWTRQATCSFAYLVSKAETFDNWQDSCNVENGRAFTQLVTDDTTTAPADHSIHFA